jgi:hypothetical protein
MTTVNDLFIVVNAKSTSFSHYGEGKVAFITNGDYESSILGYITPMDGDRVFKNKAICLSSFGDATIPPLPFMPRGNGGSGLLILTPREDMTDEELYSYASQLNIQSWKFNFSRMAISRRVYDLPLQEYSSCIDIKKRIKSLSPKKVRKQNIARKSELVNMPLVYDKKNQINGLCIAQKAPSKKVFSKNALEVGKTPYITTSSYNNGVSGKYDIEPFFKSKCLTLALNGSVGEVFFQFDDFITGGDNAILNLKDGYNPYFLFYIATMIRNHQWRYNYYRKLTMVKLKKIIIPVPMVDGEVDFNYLESIVKNSYGYKELKKFL